MTSPVPDALQCLLMAKIIAPDYMNSAARCIFWETLPDSIPDLRAHLPAVTSAVKDERYPAVLDALSSHPLPTSLPPEMAGWRPEMMAAWEKQLKTARDHLAMRLGGSDIYRYSLRGLVRMDRCGMPPGMICSSALPILLNEISYVKSHIPIVSSPSRSFQLHKQLESLSELSELASWRPGPNVRTDPAVLKTWGDFWLELYQKGNSDIPYNDDRDISIIRKGIAAKAILNLLEAGDKEETGVPAGLESLLLESLTIATEIVGEKLSASERNWDLGWLSWQPQDVTRFPLDRLAALPKTLLKRFRFSCQNSDQWWDEGLQNVLKSSLTELVRWDRAGLLAHCGIDLLHCVLPHLSCCLDNYLNHNIRSSAFLNAELCRWLLQDKVANIEEGRELLRKLENHWRRECEMMDSAWLDRTWLDRKCIAWNGRIQLQRAGLSAETASDFHNLLLKAVMKEKSAAVRILLSLWVPGKDTPDWAQEIWERVWQERLESNNYSNNHEEILRTAALVLLRPKPFDDLASRRQKLWDILSVLPENIHPQLFIAEIAYLTGEPAPGIPNADLGAAPNRMWQFSPNETRFRIPTEPATPASAPTTVQTTRPDRTTQGAVDGVQFGGHH